VAKKEELVDASTPLLDNVDIVHVVQLIRVMIILRE